MKKLAKLISTIIFYKPSKIGILGSILLGIIMGRIAANIAINVNSIQLNSALLIIVVGSWIIFFIRKVVNKNNSV